MKKMTLGLITRSISIMVVMLLLTLPASAKAGGIHHYIDWWTTFFKVAFILADIALIALLIYGIKVWKSMSAHHDAHHAGGDAHGGHTKNWSIYKAIIIVALFILAAFLSMLAWNWFWGTAEIKKSEVKMFTNGKFFDIVPTKNGGGGQQSGGGYSDAGTPQSSGNSDFQSYEKFTLHVKGDEYFSVEFDYGDSFSAGISASDYLAKFAESKEKAENIEWRPVHRGDSIKGVYNYAAFRPIDSNGLKVKYTFKSPRKGVRPTITIDKFKKE